MNISELMYDLEECKLEVESVLWEIVCDKRGVESVEDLDDRLLLVECMDDFYGGDNWELELEEVIGKGVVEGWKEINRVIEKMED